MNNFTTEDVDRLIQVDFASFLYRAFLEIYPGSPFQPNWHHDVLIARLLACQQGETRRLLVNLPPRHLKSFIGSVAYVAWLLGHDPTLQILCVSYAQDLAEKFARDTRQIMSSSWYQRAFSTRLSPDRNAVHEFYTTKGGCRFATSVTGVLTGRGADYIILDDLMKPDEAMSDIRRKSVNESFDTTIYSRLNDKRNGRIIGIMQRLHLNDLAGHLLEKGGFELLRFPAIAEDDETHSIETPFGRKTYSRRAGEALHAERESLETLTEIKQTIGSYNFAGQYQQRPVPIDGGMVRRHWIKTYTPENCPTEFEWVLQCWDTASKIGDLNSFSVCTTWGVIGDTYYLLDVLRLKLEYPDLRRMIIAHAERFQPDILLIEEKSSGMSLVPDLRDEGITVIPVKAVGDKAMRLYRQTAKFEAGHVFVPTEAPWLNDYLDELTNFPGHPHDDQVDSTAHALAWQGEGFPGWGAFEHYRRAANKLRGIGGSTAGRPKPLVRVIAPNPGTYQIYDRNTGVSKSFSVGSVPIEVTEEDARSLVSMGLKIVPR